MITEEQIQINIKQYMCALQDKFTQNQLRKKRIQYLLNSSARKIQRYYRQYIHNKKQVSARKIVNAWKKYRLKQKSQKNILQKFRRVYYGTIIVWFVNRKMRKSYKNNIQNKYITQRLCIKKYLKRVQRYLPDIHTKICALMAENRYMNKYRTYMRKDFEDRWDKYEAKLRKELRIQINKRWVKIKQNNKVYYVNEFDKKIDPEVYIQKKLDAIFQESHSKLEKDQLQIRGAQNKILNAIAYNKQLYEKCVINFHINK